MNHTLITDDQLQQFIFYGCAGDPDSMCVDRYTRYGKMRYGKPFMGTWELSAQLEISKAKARNLWRHLKANGATQSKTWMN